MRAWSSVGCYQLDRPATLNITINPLQVTLCVEGCSKQNASFALLAPAGCACLATTPLPTRVNDAECNQFCSDGYGCGGPPNRVSIYGIQPDAAIPPFSSPSPSPTSSVTTENIGKGSSIDQWKIAAIAGGVLGGLIVLGIAFLVYKRWKKNKDVSTLPRLHSKSKTTGYLLPNLPKTADMIYSVQKTYRAQRQDELTVMINHVVAVRSTFADEWALATNITAGDSGLIPLSCLVSEPMEPHSRAESLHI